MFAMLSIGTGFVPPVSGSIGRSSVGVPVTGPAFDESMIGWAWIRVVRFVLPARPI